MVVALSRPARGWVLLLFGLAVLRLASGDLLLRFVRPGARPLVLAAGGLLVVLATCTLVARGRGATGSRLGWLALLPVAALLFAAPPALGAFTAGRQGLGSLPHPGSPFAALRDGATTRMSVVEFALRSLDSHGRTLRGHRVDLLGFVVGPAAGGFLLARLTITCCAADAVAVEVLVRARAPARAANTWVEVTGTYAGQHGAALPSMDAETVQDVAAPADPYVS